MTASSVAMMRNVNAPISPTQRFLLKMARKAEDHHGHDEGVVGAEHRFEGDEQTDCQKVGPVDH